MLRNAPRAAGRVKILNKPTHRRQKMRQNVEGSLGWTMVRDAVGKRRRAAAVQDAGALVDDARMARSVLECASPLALWNEGGGSSRCESAHYFAGGVWMERTHVRCYAVDFRLSRGDERRCQLQFGLDVWGNSRLN
jgi:hypothetical protein